ncbi:hypothetical protein J4E08_22280 [Sagittula sp. NFXS13]|uniref:hypothetical protein n=1 Tax=Sagittula sp. NFXS13 TaxID=2819095 RepID=UPI0032DE5AB5
MTRTQLTDNDLRLIQQGEASWKDEYISPIMQAMLVIALPDICAELLALRGSKTADGDQLDRIEALAQHVIDDAATASAQLDTIAVSTSRAEAMITEVLTALHCGHRPTQSQLRED